MKALIGALLKHCEMTKSSKTAYKTGVANGKPSREYQLAAEVTLQDADQEVGLTLAGLACDADRREAGGAVTYHVHWNSTDLGRLVIAPPTRVFPFVRVRQVSLCPEFEGMGHHIRRDLETLNWAAERAEVKESARYSYPRLKRRQIVEEYRTACRNGEVESKESWADSRYHISRKTLWRYECEFPEVEIPSSASDLSVV